MKNFIAVLCVFVFLNSSWSKEMSTSDTLSTQKGPMVLTFVGHGSLIVQCGPMVVHIDPVSEFGDYARLPKADLILITHAHSDHLDPQAIARITQPSTRIIAAPVCREKLPDAQFLANGEKTQIGDLEIAAVPAYNILHKRPNNQPFHPRGEGNGYILQYGGLRLYIAGDTENTPEMKALRNIDVAFLPMNLPYTMTPAMVAEAAKSFQPHILYPYHFGNTDVHKLVELLKGEKKIEVRIRDLK